MSDNDLVAAFLAKGGKVQQVAEGEGAGLTPGDWRRAMQTPGRFDARRLGAQITDEDAAERESERTMERVRDAAMVGGRAAALAEMNR